MPSNNTDRPINFGAQPVHNILILGGSGFVGSHLCARLAQDRHQITVLSRNPARHKHLTVIPTLRLVRGDCHNPETLNELARGCTAVINLVGILNERRDNGKEFHRVHVLLAEKVVKACKSQGVTRLLHMSALNANAAGGPSFYLHSKGEAEDLVMSAQSEQLAVTSFQPSVIFGPNDGFFNRFAKIIRITPWILPLACPNARFKPVYVGDVVEAMALCLLDKNTAGNRYQLCGPREYRLKQLVAYTAQCIGKRRWIIGLGKFSSKMQARLLEWVPGKPMTRDNYRSLQVDSVCSRNGLDDLDIPPQAIEAIVPIYLR